MPQKTVYLALGSNLGDREANLEKAIQALESPALTVIRQSSIYETAPMLLEDQPWFLNQVIEAKTALFPRQLLHYAKDIERSLGRKRAVAKGPRIIDIDLLLYGRSVIKSEELTIPHPGMAERRFVLEPLAELSPKLRHPVLKSTIAELLAATKQQTVRRFKAIERPGL